MENKIGDNQIENSKNSSSSQLKASENIFDKDSENSVEFYECE
jgi:hypothetical protein